MSYETEETHNARLEDNKMKIQKEKPLSEERLKERMQDTFPDLLDFHNQWNEVKEFFILKGFQKSQEMMREEIDEIIDKWAKEQDIEDNFLGVRIYEVSDRSLEQLKELLSKIGVEE